MHNTAKRGVVFAVATGGLLLAGAAQSTAEAAVGIAQNGGGPAGVLSGDSIDIPAGISLNVCGNGIAVLGTTTPTADCSGETAGAASGSAAKTTTAAVAGSTGRRGGVLSALAVRAPINVPVNVCGNLAAVAGTADSGSGSTCSAGPAAGPAGGSSGGSSGSQPSPVTAVERILGGVLGAINVQAPITVPANICGNTVSAGGTSSAAVTCTSGQSAASSATAPQGASAAAPASGSANAAGSADTAANGSSGPDCSGPGSAGSAQAQALKPQQPATQLLLSARPQDLAVPALPIAAAAIPAELSLNTSSMPESAHARPAVAAVPKGRPQAAQASKPLSVDPLVVWPRPELAAVKLPGDDGLAHAAGPNHLRADLGGSALAQTGGETAIPIGAAAATLTGGIGVGALSRHGRGNRRSVRR